MIQKIKVKGKRASILDLFLWMAVGFVAIIFFAVWIYGFNLVEDTLGAMDEPLFPNDPDYQTISNMSDATLGKVEPVQRTGLHVIAFVMLFFMALSIPLTYFIQRTHPVFFIIYLLVIIAAFMTSVYISNAYEELMTNDVIGDEISEFTGASFIMLNLPIWITVIGVMGMIFLFAGILRDSGSGGSII